MIEIAVACPEYCGASYPKFDPKKINERMFENELRCKEYYASLDINGMHGEVQWLSQDSDYFSEKFESEILRAFKANGAKPGTIVDVEFGQRDYDYNQTYKLEVK